MIDLETSPMKPLTSSDRTPRPAQHLKKEHTCELFIHSSPPNNYATLSENHNPNLVKTNGYSPKVAKNKILFGTSEPKTPVGKASVRAGNAELQTAGSSPGVSKAVASEEKEAGSVTPSPSRRHFCRSPRCAANNPDYAHPVAVPLRKYLVSKRHLLQAKGEIPPIAPKSSVSALKTAPYNQIYGSQPPWGDSGVKETAGGHVEPVACRTSEEHRAFEQKRMDFEEIQQAGVQCEVIPSPVKQDSDVCFAADDEKTDARNEPIFFFQNDAKEEGNRISIHEGRSEATENEQDTKEEAKRNKVERQANEDVLYTYCVTSDCEQDAKEEGKSCYMIRNDKCHPNEESSHKCHSTTIYDEPRVHINSFVKEYNDLNFDDHTISSSTEEQGEGEEEDDNNNNGECMENDCKSDKNEGKDSCMSVTGTEQNQNLNTYQPMCRDINYDVTYSLLTRDEEGEPTSPQRRNITCSLLTRYEEGECSSPSYSEDMACYGKCNNCEDSCPCSDKDEEKAKLCSLYKNVDAVNEGNNIVFSANNDEKDKEMIVPMDTRKDFHDVSDCDIMPAFESPCLNETVKECDSPIEYFETTGDELVATIMSENSEPFPCMEDADGRKDREHQMLDACKSSSLDERQVNQKRIEYFETTGDELVATIMSEDSEPSPCMEDADGRKDREHEHQMLGACKSSSLDERQVNQKRIDNVNTESSRKVSPLGGGRVRQLVEAFENIISLAEWQVEESRIMKSQANEKVFNISPGRGMQAEDDPICKHSIASSADNHEEEVKLPAVPVKIMVDMYHSCKKSPKKSMNSVNPLDGSRLILQAENNIISKEKLDFSTIEVMSMVDRYSSEATYLASASFVDQVRSCDNGESMHSNFGHEHWERLQKFSLDRTYLTACQRVGMGVDGRDKLLSKVSLVRPDIIKDLKDATKEQDQGLSIEERGLEVIACKEKIDQEACSIEPLDNYLENEGSDSGLSVCHSFQSQRTETSLRRRSRKPKFTRLQPFALRTEARGAKKKNDFTRKLGRMFIEEQKMRIPVAQGLPWTTDEPQVLSKPPVKENTVPLDIHLFSEIRACERAEFDGYVAAKISLMEQEKKERERLKQIEEEEEIKKMRKEMVPRAQLMPYFDRPFMPNRSSKRLTIPKEPTFQFNQNKRHKCMARQG